MLVIRRIDLFADLGRMNNGERPGEFGISVNQRSVEFEDIQHTLQCEIYLDAVKVCRRIAERPSDPKSKIGFGYFDHRCVQYQGVFTHDELAPAPHANKFRFAV